MDGNHCNYKLADYCVVSGTFGVFVFENERLDGSRAKLFDYD